MRLALVGYGKMGRLIDSLAAEYDFTVVSRVGSRDSLAENLAGADVAVEFTHPAAAAGNIEKLAAAGVNAVVGTTGWSQHLPQVEEAIGRAGTGLIWSPNFSVGVNSFFRLVREAAALVKSQPDYGAWAWEIHHDAKKDAPSGTLVKVLEEMRSAGYDRPIDSSSNRAGKHPGTHEVGFDAYADTILLRHTARSREGFARGALQAARWIAGKQGVYRFDEVLFGGGSQ